MNIKKFNGITIPSAILVSIIITINGYGRLENRVSTNDTEIKSLRETPLKIAVIEKSICNLKQAFEEFKADQKDTNKMFNQKLDEILRLVK